MENKFFSNFDSNQIAVRYFNWSMIAAEFDTPLQNVLNLLPANKLRPIQVREGISAVTLMGMAYYEIDVLAPYNEFGILIPVAQTDDDEKQDIPFYYVHQLPVTTQEAYMGGVEIFGYPKFVAQITFAQDEEKAKCSVHADGKDMITLEVPTLPTTHQTLDFCTYSVKNGKLLKTWVRVEGISGKKINTPGAGFQLGDHQNAHEIKNLGMNNIPSQFQYAPKLKSILPFPVEVGSI